MYVLSYCCILYSVQTVNIWMDNLIGRKVDVGNISSHVIDGVAPSLGSERRKTKVFRWLSILTITGFLDFLLLDNMFYMTRTSGITCLLVCAVNSIVQK